ncbi:hypothetical protein UlMin_010787 [Ulmus minor]
MAEIFTQSACIQFSQMFLLLIFFHSSEYLLAVAIHGRSNVTLESFLIDKQHIIDLGLSFLEYLIEVYFVPELKELWWISYIGLAMVITGEIIRKVAIITAGNAFTHSIRTDRDKRHNMVTCGIYRYIRHPGYMGYLICSVGAQIMLCNPLATIVFAFVIWRFFAHRIAQEEYYLRQFFGAEYNEYARQVPSGLPFVK